LKQRVLKSKSKNYLDTDLRGSWRIFPQFDQKGKYQKSKAKNPAFITGYFFNNSSTKSGTPSPAFLAIAVRFGIPEIEVASGSMMYFGVFRLT